LIDLIDTVEINYNETNIFNFFVLRKQLEDDGPLYLGKEMEKYIEVRFTQQIIDWNKADNKGRY
jgi:hypothetical protein